MRPSSSVLSLVAFLIKATSLFNVKNINNHKLNNMAKFVSLFDALNSGKGLSGTIGDRVYSSWNGISYSRSKPVSVKNPRTPGQLTQRAKFITVIKFIKPLKEILTIGFQSKTKKMSAFNYAMSFMYKNALTGAYPDFSIDYPRVLLSMGDLKKAIEPKITLISPCTIEFTWQFDAWLNNCYADDKAMIIVYNTEKHETIIHMDGNPRVSMGQQVELPASFAGDEVVCYLAFRDFYGKKVSNSQFLGRLKIEE